MNIEQAKAKVDSIGKSTALKHPKVLVTELCVVVKFLLSEIERLQSSPITILSLPKRLPEDIKIDPPKRRSTPQPPEELPTELPTLLPPPPPPNKPYDPNLERKRRGDAGDAE